MKDTIKADEGYRVVRVSDGTLGQRTVELMDGGEPLFLAKDTSFAEYAEAREKNEAFNLCEVFTTVDGVQYIYWRNEEEGEDCITRASRNRMRG